MQEIWKDIKGYEGLYQISNLGHVKNTVTQKPINPFPNPQIKYLVVGLYKDGIYKRHYLHRLIGEAFIPNPHNYPQINHINENRQDNSISNLEWCNNQYNNEYSHGKPIAQLTLQGEFIRTWKSGRHIHRELGYDHSVIGKVCRGKIHTAYGYKWVYVKENA